MRKLLPPHGSPPNRGNSVKETIIAVVVLASVFAAGIFIGCIGTHESNTVEQESLVFTANRDSCVFSEGKVICMTK